MSGIILVLVLVLPSLVIVGLGAVGIWLVFARVRRAGDQPTMLSNPSGRAVRFPVMQIGHAMPMAPTLSKANSPSPESIDVTPDGLQYRVWRRHCVPRDRVLYVNRPYHSATSFLTIHVRGRSTVISVMMISRLAAEDLIVELALYYPLTPKAWELVAHRYGSGSVMPRILA